MMNDSETISLLIHILIFSGAWVSLMTFLSWKFPKVSPLLFLVIGDFVGSVIVIVLFVPLR